MTTEDSPRAGGVRARARAQFMAELLAVARERLAADGPSGLSLRAVARELGVSSSAVYRYVDSRDALLTALVIEAYDAVGEVCEQAMTASFASGASPARTWLAVGHAFRAWALENRSSFELVYGTPIPGYAAPQDTVAAASRLWGVIEAICTTAIARGELDLPPTGVEVEGLMSEGVMAFAREHLLAFGADGTTRTDGLPELEEGHVARSVTLWVALVGAVSAELFGHLHGMTSSYPRIFELTLATAAVGVGLRPDLA